MEKRFGKAKGVVNAALALLVTLSMGLMGCDMGNLNGSHTVSFVTGIEGITVSSQSIQDGQLASVPETLERNGYEVKGWYVEGSESAFDFNTPVTSDLSLTAKWAPIEYTITYDVGEGTNAEDNPATYTIESDDITLAAPKGPASAPNFVAWHIDTVEGEKISGVAISKGSTGNKTFVAEFTDKSTYSVKFYDGETVVKEESVIEGSLLSGSEIEKTGYKFEGWYTESTFENKADFTVPVNADVNLYGKYSVITFTVTFNSDGGSEVESVKVEYGKTITKPADPTTDDTAKPYFVTWTTVKNDSTKEFDFGTVISEDMTLYALWSDTKVYKITLNYNYEGSTADSVNASNATNFIINSTPSAIREGYVFGGWYADAANETKVSFPYTASEDVTLYAKWSAYDYSAASVANGAIKVKKGVAALSITDNTSNFQLAQEIFATNSTYVATAGDKLVVRMSGNSDVAIKGLKCTLVDTSAAANYWKNVSGYPTIGDVEPGFFDFQFTVECTEAGVTNGSAQKLVLMYDKDDGAVESNLTLSTFEINGKLSKPAFDLNSATVIAEYSYEDTKADGFSINGNTEGVTALNADDIYLVLTITSSDSDHNGWGAGAITNYQEPLTGDSTKVISLSTANAGTREVIYSLEEVYDAIVIAGVENPTYFNFNWWSTYGSLDKVRLMK